MTRAIFTALAGCCATFSWFAPLARPLGLAALASDSTFRITKKAVWNPPSDVLPDIRRKCTEGDPAQHETCFLNAMKSTGASEEAMAFVKEFAANGLACVRDFRDTGRVDIAYIEYLFRANDLDGVLLVNGTHLSSTSTTTNSYRRKICAKTTATPRSCRNILTSTSSLAIVTTRIGRRQSCLPRARNSKFHIFCSMVVTPVQESALPSWPSILTLPGASPERA